MAMNAVEKKWCEAVHSLESCVLCGSHGVQWAHSNQDRGMGQKSAPWLTAALCPRCHHDIDNGAKLDRDTRRAQMDRAIVKTHDRLVKLGRLVLQ